MILSTCQAGPCALSQCLSSPQECPWGWKGGVLFPAMPRADFLNSSTAASLHKHAARLPGPTPLSVGRDTPTHVVLIMPTTVTYNERASCYFIKGNQDRVSSLETFDEHHCHSPESGRFTCVTSEVTTACEAVSLPLGNSVPSSRTRSAFLIPSLVPPDRNATHSQPARRQRGSFPIAITQRLSAPPAALLTPSTGAPPHCSLELCFSPQPLVADTRDERASRHVGGRVAQ